MSEFLSFDIKAPMELRIQLTTKAIELGRAAGCYTDEYRIYSRSRRILIDASSDGEVYYLHMGGHVFTCKISPEKTNPNIKYFVVTKIMPETYSSKNNALHYGLCFYFENGVIISYISDNGFHYKNGSAVLSAFAGKNCTVAIEFVRNCFSDKRAEVRTEENSPELLSYLNLASQYSEAEYMLEETKAATVPALYYDKVSGCDYERIANSAYRFCVDRADEKSYPLNTKVEIPDINDEKIQATVIDSGKDGEAIFIDLLFNEQLSIDKIQCPGSISLSFSGVNRDVQMKAIGKIEDGSSDAGYMNRVLGKAEPAGFEKIDFTKLENELDSYENAPNPSQVDAIKKGISSKDVYLVMGPPGTGKTTVILEWIKYFVKEKNQRVLVSSQNNKAVDNVLERIVKEEGIDALRIGSENKVTELVKPYLFELKLAELRKKIKEGTDSHIFDLKENMVYWSEISGKAEREEEFYKGKKELEDELEKSVKRLNYLSGELENSFTLIGNSQNKLSSDVFKINELIDKEESYLASGFFIRFFLKPFSWFRNKKISSQIRNYDENIKRLNLLYESYRVSKEEFLSLFDNTAYGTFAKEREFAELLSEKIKDISVDFDKSDRLGVFDFNELKDLELTDYRFFEGITIGFKRKNSRAESIISELEKWQSASVDTANYTLKNILLEGVNLVGATCIGINSQHRFSDLKFDVSIIDEAGQIQIHNALVPMSVSNKLIMLGDHKQIPPSADQELIEVLEEHEIPTSLLEVSLFEDMYNRLPDENKSMLDIQYRMPSEIADIISGWFYGGKYRSFSKKSNLPSIIPWLTSSPFLIIDTSEGGKERFERNIPMGEQTLHDNPLEAEIAARIVSCLNRNEFPLGEVGVISALKAQVDLIRLNLRKKGIDSVTANETAATLDSYQGQERKIIIYSFTRSADKSPERNGVGFLTELRRLNVAMSRCKQALIMIGDMKFLSERESVKDFNGNVISDENKTEKRFSEFMRYMLSQTRKGGGEIINIDTFNARMKAAEEEGGI